MRLADFSATTFLGRRILGAIVFAYLLFAASLGFSQGWFPLVAIVYQGPGDIVSGAFAWFGLRAYTKAYALSTGTVGIFVRSSDSTTCTGIVNTAGNLDITTTYCPGSANLPTFCGTSAGHCTVSQMNDQTGNGNTATQATGADQPTLTFSCLGSLPCLSFNLTSGMKLKTATFTHSAQPFAFSSVAERIGNFTTTQQVLSGFGGTSAGDCGDGYISTTNEVQQYCGSAVGITGGTNSTLLAVQMYMNGNGSSVTNIGGTETTGTSPNTNGIGDNGLALGDNVSNVEQPLDGYIGEAGLWESGAGYSTSTQRNNVCHNQRIYWSAAGSC